MFSESFIAEVKARADCVEIAQSWGLTVRHNSARCIKPENHKHADIHPSLYITPQGFKCMSPACDIHGDCFQLIKEKLGLGFAECVLYVCALYKITPENLKEKVKEQKQEVKKLERKEKKDQIVERIVKERKVIEREHKKLDSIRVDPGKLPERILELKEPDSYAKYCHEAYLNLLESTEAQAYLLGRGISMNTVHKCFLGFKDGCIVVPYIIGAKIVYYSARSIKEKAFYQPPGTIPCPIGFDNLKDNRVIYIAEGLFDYLTLIEKGYAAIGVPGANNWKYSLEWNSLLLGNKIMLCFHADEEGLKTNKMLADLCQGLSVPYEVIDWSRDKNIEVKDINEYVQRGGDIDYLFNNEEKITLDGIKSTLSQLIDLSNYIEAIDLAIAIVVANCLSGDPVWILFVGPPSVGKTEIIRSLNNAVSTYFINRITPNTFVSGWSKGEYSDIITRIVKATTFCVTDFGSFLSFHPQDIQKVFQQFRDIYDGRVHAEYGNGKILDWRGKVGIIGGVTGEIERHTSFIGRLGDRFLYYRMEILNSKRQDIALNALINNVEEGRLRQEISEKTSRFLDRKINNIEQAEKIEIDLEVARKIAAVCDLLARGRTPIARMHDMEKTIEYKPEYEMTGRIARAFKALAKALAFVRDKKVAGEEEFKVIRSVAHGSIPSLRLEFLRAAYEQKDIWLETRKFGEHLGKDTNSARYHLKNLLALKLIQIDTSLSRDHKWRIAPEAVEMIEESSFFDDYRKPENVYDEIEIEERDPLEEIRIWEEKKEERKNDN